MYKVVFIGQPGRGKTTIICNWLGLLKADIVGHSDVDAVSLLPTATGRTTVAEVHIRQCAESSSHIRVEYLPVEQQKTYIKEFCDDYYQCCAGLVPDVTDATAYTDEDRTSHDNARGKTADSPHLEIDRLIRNMVGLPLHREAQRQEIIGSVLRYGSTEDFFNEVVRRANLDNRQQRDFEIEHGDGFREELARLFRGLNNGNLETASIPKRINIDLSPQDIDLHLPEDVDEVIDTIGLDESVRDDLQERLRNPSAICVLVDRLENPPSQPIRSLLESIPTDEHEIVKRKTALFINSNWDELSRVNGADGNQQLGIEIKRQEIDRVVRMGNIPYDINNTLFEDPCGAYHVVSQSASMHRDLRQQPGRGVRSSIIDYDAEEAEKFRFRINVHLETIARQLRFSEVRIKFARLKDSTITAIRAKLGAAQAIGVGMPTVAERLSALEDELVACKKRADDGTIDLETAESDAEELKRRVGVLEDEVRQTAMLSIAAEKARKLEETAYVSEDAPLFAKEEMETTRRVLEIVARQTDFTKAEKAAMVLRDAKRRKQRIENAVRVYAGLADRLEKISQLEQRTEEARRKLLWRDTSIGPAPSGQAVSIRSSRSLDGFTKELERRKEQLAAALPSFESARQSQFAAFREMAAEALCTGKTERHRLARLLDLHEDDQFDVAFDEESASWYIRGIGWAEDRTLQLDPQPSILFDRTRAGTFEARCLFVLAWYKLLLDMRRKRQEDALRDEGIGDVPSGHVSPFPAPAFLRLRELAGSRPVDDPEVRKLVATNRAWDELCNRILKTMPVKNGEADAGHRRMFRQANDAVQRLAEMCDMSPVGSRDVQTELGRLQEASAWVKRSRKLREHALEARSGVIRDVEELGLFGRRIEPDPYLEKGDGLFSQSDFQGATAAFETARRDLNFFFEEWDFQIESCSDSHFAVSLANADDLLEFVKSEVVVNGSKNRKNVLWYGRYAITGKQYRAFFPKAESADFYKSGSCTAVTIDEAKEYAEKITILARRANFRLPDGSSAVFRLPHFKEWKAGIECNAFQTNSLLYEWCETYSRDYAWWFSMNGQQGRNPRYNRYSNIGFRLVCNRIG